VAAAEEKVKDYTALDHHSAIDIIAHQCYGDLTSSEMLTLHLQDVTHGKAAHHF
jgi:hypothetical protein